MKKKYRKRWKNLGLPKYMQAAVNVVFMQMHANKGIKLFGEMDIAATIKELKKLYEGAMPGNTVVIPIDPDELTDAEMRQVLEAVNLTKEKEIG